MGRMSIGDVVYRMLKMWEEAEQLPEMAHVRFDIAKDILLNTWSVEEMLLDHLPIAGGPRLYDKAQAAGEETKP